MPDLDADHAMADFYLPAMILHERHFQGQQQGSHFNLFISDVTLIHQ